MRKNSPSPHDDGDSDAPSGTTGLYPIRDRFRFKRNSNPNTKSVLKTSSTSSLSDRRGRSHGHGFRSIVHRKLFSVRGTSLCYLCILVVVFAFVLVSIMLQSSIGLMVFRQGGDDGIGRTVRQSLKFGSSLKFVSLKGFEIESERNMPRVGVRSPRLATIIGTMNTDPSSLMFLTVMKILRELGYTLQIYTTDDGKSKPLWEKNVGQVSILSPENYGHIDWSIFDGVVVNSLEAYDAISRYLCPPKLKGFWKKQYNRKIEEMLYIFGHV